MYIHTRMSVRNFVYSKDLEGSCGQYSVANCRCDVSAFDLRKSMWRLSKIDVATFAFPVFLSGFGPRGGKTAICNLVGGHGSLNITLTIHKA